MPNRHSETNFRFFADQFKQKRIIVKYEKTSNAVSNNSNTSSNTSTSSETSRMIDSLSRVPVSSTDVSDLQNTVTQDHCYSAFQIPSDATQDVSNNRVPFYYYFRRNEENLQKSCVVKKSVSFNLSSNRTSTPQKKTQVSEYTSLSPKKKLKIHKFSTPSRDDEEANLLNNSLQNANFENSIILDLNFPENIISWNAGKDECDDAYDVLDLIQRSDNSETGHEMSQFVLKFESDDDYVINDCCVNSPQSSVKMEDTSLNFGRFSMHNAVLETNDLDVKLIGRKRLAFIEAEKKIKNIYNNIYKKSGTNKL